MTIAGIRLSRFWGDSSLQRRIALSTGLVTTVLVMVFSATVGSILTRSINSAIDQDLQLAAADFYRRPGAGADRPLRSPSLDGQRLGGAPGTEGPGAPGEARLRRAPAPFAVQVVTPDGQAVTGAIPMTSEALAVASGTQAETYETIESNGRHLRVYNTTLESETGGALRVAIDMTTSFKGLQQARLLSLAAGLLAGLTAAAVALMLGRHLVAPVTAVANAVSNVRSGGELPDRLEGEGTDELGTLVHSFNSMLDHLRQSRDQQRRLVADASHELRTPLTRLRLKIEFVHTQPQLPEQERQRLIEGAVADLSLLGDLVAELLELAAEGTSAEQSQPLQLANVVSTEVDRFRTTSGRVVDLATTPGLVQTRPRQVTRALTNLLVNADKYSPPNSAISVEQRGTQIEVRDRGPGIPTTERTRVFDRFYRGNTCQTVDGSGLGLAIVESVARVNGGTTWIRDPADGGPGTIVGFSVGPIPSSSREPTFRPRAIQRRS